MNAPNTSAAGPHPSPFPEEEGAKPAAWSVSAKTLWRVQALQWQKPAHRACNGAGALRAGAENHGKDGEIRNKRVLERSWHHRNRCPLSDGSGCPAPRHADFRLQIACGAVAWSFVYLAALPLTRQMVLPTSSATSSAPRRSSSTPTGRPKALPSSLTKPVSTSSGRPLG